jgi:multiple sugar transport system substrate-binding protein
MYFRRSLLKIGLGASLGAVVMAAPMTIAEARTSATTVTVGMPYGTFFRPPVDTASAICKKKYGITLKSVTDPADYNQYDLKLQLQAAAGKAPDLAVQGLNEVISMGDDRYVADLSSHIKGQALYSAKTMPAIAAGRVARRQVAIPWGISTPVIFVNQALFTAAGIDPSTPFKTWADVQAAAVRLTNAQSGQFGVAIANQESWMPLQFLLNSGSNFTDPKGHPIFNNANGLFAARLLQQLYTSGAALSGTDDQLSEAFAQGKAAMFVGSSSFFPGLAKATFKWITLPFPLVRTGIKTRIAAGGAGISVFAKPARRDVAFKALDCLFAPTPIRDVVQKLGYMPVRSDVNRLLKPGLLTTQPYAAAFAELPLVVPWYAFYGKQGAQALKQFDDAWQKATHSGGDPAPGLESAADAIASLTGR